MRTHRDDIATGSSLMTCHLLHILIELEHSVIAQVKKWYSQIIHVLASMARWGASLKC